MPKEIVEYTDDLDGEPIDRGLAQTFRFTVDDVAYEIDLRPAHAEKFREGIARLLAAARSACVRTGIAGTQTQPLLPRRRVRP